MRVLLSLCIFVLASCEQHVNDLEDINKPPVFSEQDRHFADVYKLLDGTWKGRFLIYEDTTLVPKQEAKLKQLTKADLKGLQLIDHLDVTQVYTSESPYFQRVTITDQFKDGSVAVSKGVNKVVNGEMWCIVHKPDKIVIHEGATDGANTIIWSSNETSPQVIEYFQETVEAERYEIIGWGYYDGDDPTLSPRLWFYSEYQRQ